MPALPRLVRWREEVARTGRASYAGQHYWGRGVPGFGDPAAALILVGLAPAAHGANRTGRMFTGDRSGDWLFAALFKAGFASQPTSTAADDGLTLRDTYITATVHCAPPDNKPTPDERANCAPYLSRELALLTRAAVVVALGQVAWNALAAALRDAAAAPLRAPGRDVVARWPPAARLVPPEPAEHVHREAHRADVRRRVRPSQGADRPGGTLRPVPVSGRPV